jgi:hypothetical protein
MRETRSYGSVRGAAGNSRPYRERRNAETIHTRRRPASEKRQGTKSRLEGRGGGGSLYGDLAAAWGSARMGRGG